MALSATHFTDQWFHAEFIRFVGIFELGTAIMIELTDGEGNKRSVDPTQIRMLYFAKGLSPKNSKSTLLFGRSIRSFAEDPAKIVNLIGASVKFIKLTLPKGPAADRGPVWFNVAAIAEIKAAGPVASILLSGSAGYIRVSETKAQVEEAIAAA